MAFFNKPNSRKFFSNSVLIGGCMIFGYAAANDTVVVAPEAFMPFSMAALPGASIYALGGNGETVYGDLMAPVFGHPLNFTYVDPQLYYHSPNHNASASLALGQRWMTPTAGILGAYVFGDYNHASGNDFWFVSPGFERLGQFWDFSANLYIPVSTQRVNTGLKFADQAGDFDQITFTGHTQYDELVNTFESTGWGGDTQIGVRLPFRNSKVYVGAYYFEPKDTSSITGGLVRAEVPLNNFISVVMSEAYDSEYHNTLKAGLTLWFGGRNTGYSYSGNLADRMVDPIQRNAIAVAGGSSNAQPVVNGTEGTDQIAIEKSNISFFVPTTAPSDNSGAVSGDGTYENPYKGMSQDNVDNANSQNNRNFYIDSGVYNAIYNPSVNADFIVLNNDQLYGRQNNFTETASGSLRPDINFSSGGFLVPGGDSSDSFNDLQLTGKDVTGTAGIFVDHESGANVNVAINDLAIAHFGDGIDVYNTTDAGTDVNISNSQISNNRGGGMFGLGAGIAVDNEGSGALSTIINDSNITENTNGVTAVTNNNNSASNSLNLTINSSNLSNNDSTGLVLGALAGESDLNAYIYNSIFSNNGEYGIALINGNNAGTFNLTIDHSQINDNSQYGLFSAMGGNSGDTHINIKGSKITGNGLDGLFLANSANSGDTFLTITNSTIDGNGSDGIDIIDQFNTGDVDVSFKHVKITNNGGSGINVSNFTNFGSLTLNVDNALISNNTGSGVNLSSTNSPGITTLDISHANINGNNIGVNVGSTYNNLLITDPTNVTVTIDQSRISNNNIGVNLISTTSAGSNAIPTVSNLTATITNSIIGRNTIAGISASSLAIGNGKPAANTTVTINNSLITGNAVGVMANSSATTLAGTPSAVTTVNITQSTITLNGVGVSTLSVKPLGGTATTNVTIDQSIVAGNLIALEAAAAGGTSNITVTDPVFFSGTVKILGTGGASINFPNITPNNNDRVVCIPGSPTGCFIVTP